MRICRSHVVMMGTVATVAACSESLVGPTHDVIRERVLPSAWVNEPPTIDGDGEQDWATSALQPVVEPFHIAAQNDARSLYLMVHTADPDAEAHIRHHGFSISFNPNGTCTKAVEIVIPPTEFEPDLGRGAGRAEAVLSSTPKPRASANSVIRWRQQGAEERVFPTHGDTFAEVGLGSRDGNFSHEIRIDLHALRADPGQRVAFTINLTLPPTPDAEGPAVPSRSPRSAMLSSGAIPSSGAMSPGSPVLPTPAAQPTAATPLSARSIERCMILKLAKAGI